MPRICSVFKTAILGCAVALAVSSATQARGFKVVHYFAGGSGDGALPNEVYPLDKDHLYLTTYEGGETGAGTVSVLNKKGGVTILHSFGHADPYDGKFPAGSLTFDHNPDGSVSLLGTTSGGGLPTYGTIFEIGPDGSQYARIYDFQGNQSGDGREPTGGLKYNSKDGYFYGTTRAGGDANNDGTVFKFGGYAHGYSYALFRTFFNAPDGANPYADPCFDMDMGSIFVTTAAGGAYNLGTIASTDINGNEHLIWAFSGNGDGAYPEGTLVEFAGSLYGTTEGGGSDGLGTIFRINPDGSGYSVLYSFKGICCGRSDGSFPVGGLVLQNNYLYGTTINGGSASDLGTVFKFDPNSGAETVLHAFTGADGAHPYTRVAFLGKKTLYGTTNGGGPHNNGVLFKMTVQ